MADWIIDLGAGGRRAWGEIVAETPQDVVKADRSYMGRYLAPLFGLDQRTAAE